MDALTDAEKSKCRYHLGYMASGTAASFQLGIPRPVQTVFLLESAMSLLVEDNAVARARQILCVLDATDARIMGAQQTLAAEQLGKLTLHPLRNRGVLFTDSLEREYVRWAKRLADILGCPIYPYSDRFRRHGPGSKVPIT